MELVHTEDMVVGSRAMTDVSIPMIRRPAKMFLSALASYLSGRRIPDLNSGLRVMRRSTLMQFIQLLPSGFSFTTTITLAMLCTGRRVRYIPVACSPRVGCRRFARDFTDFLVLVIRTVVLFNPLKVFLPLGTVLFFRVRRSSYTTCSWNLSNRR